MSWDTYIPSVSKDYFYCLLKGEALTIKVVNRRKTKLGDYMMHPQRGHVITLNNNLNEYAFVLTLCHELAHYFVYKKYSWRIKPHGMEWKKCFKEIMRPLWGKDIFPDDLEQGLKNYMQDPKASSCIDIDLKRKLQLAEIKNEEKNICFLDDMKVGGLFKLSNGKEFKIIKKNRTRVRCINLFNKRLYTIHKAVEVIPLPF